MTEKNHLNAKERYASEHPYDHNKQSEQYTELLLSENKIAPNDSSAFLDGATRFNVPPVLSAYCEVTDVVKPLDTPFCQGHRARSEGHVVNDLIKR